MCCDKNRRISLPHPRMLKHDMLEVEMGSNHGTEKTIGKSTDPRSSLKIPYLHCLLKNGFRFDLCLQLLAVTRQTRVAGKPMQI